MSHTRGSFRLFVLMAALVFVSAFAHSGIGAQGRTGGQSRTGSQSRVACPLTDAQAARSIDAFARIAAFLTTEPRCVNCHGGVNPFIKGTGLDPDDDLDNPTPASKVTHGGGAVRRQRETAPDGTRLMEGECMDCHNNMVRKRDGSPSRWTLAPTFLSFVDKDATTLCRQIKRAAGNADHFLGHLKDDNGGNTFALTAFKGDRGLDPDQFEFMKPDPPKISHAALMQLGQNWVTAMGGSFKGDESCGCELRHARWSGQIHYTFDSQGPTGHDDQVDMSARRFSQSIFTFNDGVGRVASQADVNMKDELRRGVVNNGSVSLIKDASHDTTGSGGRTFAATVEVRFRDNGDYSIEPAVSGSQQVGTSRTISCQYDRNGGAKCDTQDLPLFPETWRAGELSGNSRDPNHVQGSKTDRQEGIGSGNNRNGVIIRTLTWDLWRTN